MENKNNINEFNNSQFSLLINILNQDSPSEFIKSNEEKIFKILPEFKMCKNFNQNNIWHVYDVYEHILHVIDGVPNNTNLRLAALFHDMGKPFVYKEDEFGVGHFYGHWIKSKEIFDSFAEKYNINKSSKDIISNLILYHDLNIEKITDEEIIKLFNIFNIEGIDMLFKLKESDLLAQNEKFHYLLNEYNNQKDKILSKKSVSKE